MKANRINFIVRKSHMSKQNNHRLFAMTDRELVVMLINCFLVPLAGLLIFNILASYNI